MDEGSIVSGEFASNMKTGDIQSNGRWCEGCNTYHGLLFICDKYPDWLVEKLELSGEKYVANLRSREWCNKQMTERNISIEAIATFRAIAGIASDDWTK